MTMVAAGVAMGSGSPLIGWLRSSDSIGLLKHAFEQVRSGKST
jgi:NAD dependent epimerase/dehydratase family enzyme